MLTKEQVMERTKTLGASEIPAIMGLDDQKTLFKVWHSKLYPNTEPAPDTPQQSRGHFMEPTIARMYQRDHGRAVHVCQQLFRHFSYDWLTCTPDYGIEVDGQPYGRLLECKTAGHRYFDEAECPKDYEAQARTQTAITGIDATVAAMNAHAFAEGTPFYWEILRDKEQERTILEAAEHFWFTYVVARKEPPPDKSEEYASYCNLQPSKGKELELTGLEVELAAQEDPDLSEEARKERQDRKELLETLSEYRRVSKEISALEGQKDLLLNTSRLLCRDYDVVRGPFGSFHYKQQEGSEKIDWEQTARYLGLQYKVKPEDFEAMVKIHTRVIPGVRKPNPRWKK